VNVRGFGGVDVDSRLAHTSGFSAKPMLKTARIHRRAQFGCKIWSDVINNPSSLSCLTIYVRRRRSFSTVDALLSHCSGYAAEVTSNTSSSVLLLSPEFLFPLAQNSTTALHSLKPSHAMHTEQLFLGYRWLEVLGSGPVAASASLEVLGCSLLSLASLWLNLYLSIHALQTLLHS
jgi:hypothetical protein